MIVWTQELNTLLDKRTGRYMVYVHVGDIWGERVFAF